ncbi:S-methyl-5-thioribose-1-phosphate isomerase [Alicyclobacillus sp. ALC3]|uniref:S-methyl-5-thioribose-1-phosphate isomerase n=1 Tax=Alicyclobacillus sp. ALC3 TaxID=2796143 RepID=UPI00237862FD|nr:S-methyl-5-thioribose-1-phosphate isomerase [Alicyclobacillus sp. ALC3]WDL97231.1 S-methyl-5-thioribose-1-phosphate isomerase [Alicyclobacillus sp. ALC3]
MRSLRFIDGKLELLDQRKLPHQTVWLTCRDAFDVAQAIRDMVVRGAPAIATSAAYGLAMEASQARDLGDLDLQAHLGQAIEALLQSRPTAVNLRWAMTRMTQALKPEVRGKVSIEDALLTEAKAIDSEDIATNQAIGHSGLSLFAGQTGLQVLTHCNTGSLATSGYGTALGVIRSLHESGQLQSVWVDETRPYLQGARLTTYELQEENIPYQLITDSTAAHVMQQGWVDAVIVGADRIARNGDTANKIGTYSLAVLCHYHQVPFYVAAPWSTFDLELDSGQAIPIETRSGEEVTRMGDTLLAAVGATALHVAFDVTPHELITGIVTERGVITHPDTQSITLLTSERDREELH